MKIRKFIILFAIIVVTTVMELYLARGANASPRVKNAVDDSTKKNVQEAEQSDKKIEDYSGNNNVFIIMPLTDYYKNVPPIFGDGNQLNQEDSKKVSTESNIDSEYMKMVNRSIDDVDIDEESSDNVDYEYYIERSYSQN
jgi:hypothetical protein